MPPGRPRLSRCMLANNETGALQPVGEVADIVHEAGGLLHVDAIQALGKIPFDFKSMKADLVTLSAHKIGGPKGVGALVLAEDVQGLEPLLRGGGQELGRRAGTENVAGIAAFGAAVRAAMAALEGDAARLQGLRNRLEKGLRQTPGMIVFSGRRPAVTKYHPVHRSRPEGRNGRNWLRSRRYCGILGLRLLVRARSSRRTSWRPWGSAGNWPRERCGSVWAGLPQRQTLIWPFEAWRKLADALLKGRRNTA